jgi:DNA-binding PucR family transcriptional regulator
MVKGEGADSLVRELATRLDRRLLAVRCGEEPLWACWLGGRRLLAAEQALQALRDIAVRERLVTVGEPGEGITGWRLSHRQAKVALSVAERIKRSVLRYLDVALLASILQDDLLASSLRGAFLKPLEPDSEAGEALRSTLDSYFACDRSAASAAAALGVSRQTVNNRLRAAEERLGRPLRSCAAELEAALRLAAAESFP